MVEIALLLFSRCSANSRRGFLLRRNLIEACGNCFMRALSLGASHVSSFSSYDSHVRVFLVKLLHGPVLTPHIAWAAEAARKRLIQETHDNVADFLGREPRNLVG